MNQSFLNLLTSFFLLSLPFSVFAAGLAVAPGARLQTDSRNSLALSAEEAIYNYFYPSGRRVQKIRLEGYRRTNSQLENYLVEADVRAESPVSRSMIDYRCGVFLQKLRNSWDERYTDCESLAQ
jgi:hypothetical protein